MRRASIVAGGVALLASVSPASEPSPALADLGWMAGEWRSEEAGVSREELWTGPGGGVMLGVHRDAKRGEPAAWEFLRIQEEPEGLVYHASPGGAAPTPFALVELGDRRAVFANPEHDFPKRIVYWIAADGTLNARADAGEGTSGPEWTWRRAN